MLRSPFQALLALPDDPDEVKAETSLSRSSEERKRVELRIGGMTVSCEGKDFLLMEVWSLCCGD